MNITVEPNFERVAVQYIKRVSQEEIIGTLAKEIRKQSRKLAREIIESLDVQVFLKHGLDGRDSLATRVSKK